MFGERDRRCALPVLRKRGKGGRGYGDGDRRERCDRSKIPYDGHAASLGETAIENVRQCGRYNRTERRVASDWRSFRRRCRRDRARLIVEIAAYRSQQPVAFVDAIDRRRGNGLVFCDARRARCCADAAGNAAA